MYDLQNRLPVSHVSFGDVFFFLLVFALTTFSQTPTASRFPPGSRPLQPAGFSFEWTSGLPRVTDARLNFQAGDVDVDLLRGEEYFVLSPGSSSELNVSGEVLFAGYGDHLAASAQMSPVVLLFASEKPDETGRHHVSRSALMKRCRHWIQAGARGFLLVLGPDESINSAIEMMRQEDAETLSVPSFVITWDMGRILISNSRGGNLMLQSRLALKPEFRPFVMNAVISGQVKTERNERIHRAAAAWCGAPVPGNRALPILAFQGLAPEDDFLSVVTTWHETAQHNNIGFIVLRYSPTSTQGLMEELSRQLASTGRFAALICDFGELDPLETQTVWTTISGNLAYSRLTHGQLSLPVEKRTHLRSPLASLASSEGWPIAVLDRPREAASGDQSAQESRWQEFGRRLLELGGSSRDASRVESGSSAGR